MTALLSAPLQLAGRVLLIFLFIGFIIQGSWSIARVLVSILGFGACVMVAVGFKARWSASFLVLLLSVFNVSLSASSMRSLSDRRLPPCSFSSTTSGQSTPPTRPATF